METETDTVETTAPHEATTGETEQPAQETPSPKSGAPTAVPANNDDSRSENSSEESVPAQDLIQGNDDEEETLEQQNEAQEPNFRAEDDTEELSSSDEEDAGDKDHPCPTKIRWGVPVVMFGFLTTVGVAAAAETLGGAEIARGVCAGIAIGVVGITWLL